MTPHPRAFSPDNHDTLSTYERYLRLDELLALQKPESERLHPDELLFQVVHQSIELWWKAALSDLAAVHSALDGADDTRAVRALRRAIALQMLATQALHQLDTLAPADFLVIRAGLGDGSGADSPGFRAILRAAPPLWDAFSARLARAGTTLLDLYRAPNTHLDLFAAAEALLDFDEQFHLFRVAHLLLAQRQLGPSAIGTGGTPLPALARTLDDRLFPPLWKVRDDLLATSVHSAGTDHE